MKKTTSNLNNIRYPLFVLYEKPYSIEYTLDKIYVTRKKGSHKELVDNKNLSGDYFARLLDMERRLVFDYTCKSLQDLVYCKAKWGIDANAVPYDFSAVKYKHKEQKKVKRIRGNLIWLDRISYPFKINTSEKLKIEDAIYANLVRVNDEWYISSFSLERDNEAWLK